MKIHLINFRCFEDQTFEFGDNEVNLISASSGAGKSTILNGINFVLYGTGTNIVSKNKKTCTVKLEYGDMKIIRTAKPNKLILNDLYEDESAQKIINERFGDDFDVTGYIQQDSSKSFIEKEPSKKREFLIKFAFNDINLTEIQKINKTITTQRNEDLIKTVTQLQCSSDIFSELQVPVHIVYPFNKSKYDYDTLVKNENKKLKHCDKNIKTTRVEIEKTHEELSELLVLKTNLENKEENISSLNDKISSLEIESQSVIYEGCEKLKMYKNILEKLLSQRELIGFEDKLHNDLEKLDEMKRIESEKFNHDLDTINKTLWSEYVEEEVKNIIKDTKDSLKDVKHILFLKTQIEDCYVDVIELEKTKKKLEDLRNETNIKLKILENIKMQKTIYNCPSCNNKLQFKENTLYLTVENSYDSDIPEIHIDIITQDILNLQTKIKKLEDTISTKENKIKRKVKFEIDIIDISTKYEDELDESALIDDLEYLENYYKSELAKEKQKLIIESNIKNYYFSSSCTYIEKDLLKLRSRIEKIKEVISDIDLEQLEEYKENDLRNLIIKEENSKDLLERITENKYKLEKEKNEIQEQIVIIRDKYIKKYSNIKCEIELEKCIIDNKNIITEQEKKKNDTNEKIKNIRKYDEYIENKKKYDLHETKKLNLKAKEIEDRSRYSASLLLKEKILEAESIAVSKIIETINIHAQVYLDYFFIDNPIIVRLLSFKDTDKDTIPKINIKIDYKGMVYTDCKSLSGGENRRVSLAFTLALGEMVNTPLLMLDEITGSLDQDTATLIFDSIKENYKDKMVIIVAHQVVEGMFDRIIKLE